MLLVIEYYLIFYFFDYLYFTLDLIINKINLSADWDKESMKNKEAILY